MVGNKVELWNKLMKEVKLKRVAGPFDHIPFDNFIQSPIGLVPKAGGNQTQLIFHLSYDCKHDGIKSLNFYTPKERCSVKYKDLDFAIQAYLCVCESVEAGKNLPNLAGKSNWLNKFDQHKRKNRTVFVGKSDIKSAFRILGLSPESWPWLLMKAQDPLSGNSSMTSVCPSEQVSAVPCSRNFLMHFVIYSNIGQRLIP